MFKKMLIVVALLGVCVSVFGESYRWIYCMENGIDLADTGSVTLTQRCEVAVAIKCARYLDGTDDNDTYSVSGVTFTTDQMTEWCLRGNLNPNSVFSRINYYFWTANSVETSGYDVTDVQINYIIHKKMPVFAALIGTGRL